MPALLAAIRDAARRPGVAIFPGRRIHPRPDDHAEDCREGSDPGGPDNDPAPSRSVLAERREIEPVRDGAGIRAQPRTGRGVLDHFAGGLGHIDLLPIGPREFPERRQIRDPHLHRPLVHFGDLLDARAADRLLRPCLCGAPDHGVRDLDLLFSRIRVHDVRTVVELVDRAAVERRQANGGCRPADAEPGEGLRRRERDLQRIDRLSTRDAIRQPHVRKVPVHDADGRREPEEKNQAERDAEPAVNEDERALHGEDGNKGGRR